MSKPKRTQIPFPGGSGLTPTGAMQFRDDWPGLFLRGDYAIRLLIGIEGLQKHLSGKENVEVFAALQMLNEIGEIIQRNVIVRAINVEDNRRSAETERAQRCLAALGRNQIV